MFRYLIVFISFFVFSCTELNQHKGVGNSTSPTASSGSTSDNLSRVALVIGNGNYHNAKIGTYFFDPLRNPVNDAEDMAKVLKNLGFEIILKTDVKTRTAMEEAVVAFWDRLRETPSADVGLFYFSGHGFQYQNINYLVPAEAAIANRLNIKNKVLDTDYVLDHLEDANRQGVNLMILDACRDSIPASFFDDRKNKGLFAEHLLKVGFTNMKAPVGSLIAYSTAPNTVSWGGLPGERNSVYTKYLLTGLREKPYLNVTHLLMNVRRGVIAETVDDGEQKPWEHTSLTHPFCFKPPCMSESEYQLRLKMVDLNPEGSTQEIAELKAALQRQKEVEAQRIAELQRQADTQRIAELEARLKRETQFQQQALLQAELKQAEVAYINSTAGEVFRDRLRDGSLGPEMVWIPAGTFRMGDIQGGGWEDEQPVHRVSMNQFAMGRYEVTFAEYDQFAQATGREESSDEGWGRGNRPVINVFWNDATGYAEWLSEQTGQTYRLPTEAEWEYAARAGSNTKYWWGNEIGKNRAACGGCGAKWGWDAKRMTAPIGSFAPNQFGLYDTVGNVWEWTCSEYENRYKGKEKYCLSKNRAKSDSLFVLRGGSWGDDARGTRSSDRGGGSRANRGGDHGFRLARLF
jgi:formylglycine-generating enzyme required for sulfatase activity